MKALLLTEYGKLSIADLPIPAVGDHDALIRVRACGVCGSDVHGYDGSTGRRIPPLVMGHEASGVIERVGDAVTDFRPGDRVTIDSTVSCGQCAFCRRGEVNLCDRRMVLGVSCDEFRRDGAFAEYVAVPAHILYRLPAALSFDHSTVIEALSVAVHAVGRRSPRPDETVLVIGCGMIGLLVLQVLRDRGRRVIVAVDVDEERRALAARLGADHTIDARRSDVPAAVRDLTNGQGADLAFEVVGRSETVNVAIASVRKGGTVTLVGNLAPSVELPLQRVVARELSLLGSCASSGEYPAAIDLLARGTVDVSPLISVSAPLEEGPAWFESLHRGDGRLMKVILNP